MSVLKNCPDYPLKEINDMRRLAAKHQQPDFILRSEQVTLAVDLAKVHVSIGHLQRQFQDVNKAHCHFMEAIDNLNACGDCGSAYPERMNIMQEARKSLFEIGSQIDWLYSNS